MIFDTQGLLQKNGFGDGSCLADFCREHNLKDIDQCAALCRIVREHVLPRLDQQVEAVEVGGIHNPIRARLLDGVEVEADWYLEWNRITPAQVEVEDSVIRQICQQCPLEPIQSKRAQLQHLTELLVTSGYEALPTYVIDVRSHLCEVGFQKEFRDSEGIRYCLNCWGSWVYDFPVRRNTWSWMVQLVVNKPHLEFQQHFGVVKDNGDIAIFERRAQTFFEAMEQPYYERFNHI